MYVQHRSHVTSIIIQRKATIIRKRNVSVGAPSIRVLPYSQCLVELRAKSHNARTRTRSRRVCYYNSQCVFAVCQSDSDMKLLILEDLELIHFVRFIYSVTTPGALSSHPFVKNICFFHLKKPPYCRWRKKRLYLEPQLYSRPALHFY